jgi:hypothetical protein
MSLFVSCYKTFVTTLWQPMPQPHQTPYPLQILTLLLPSFFTPADLKSKPQTTRNYQTEWGKKKKRQYPPQSPKPPLSSSLTTQHKHLLTFHILFLLSLFSFSDQNRTPNQPGNCQKKKKKQLKPK